MMERVSAAAAAKRCEELLEKLPNGSDYLEACRDFYLAAGAGSVRKTDLEAILRAALQDGLPQGAEIPDGIRIREGLKGTHQVVLPSTTGPVRLPAWLHFSKPIDSPPSYSIVEVFVPDRAIQSVRIAGTFVRPLGLPVAAVACFGDPEKVDNWIQEQRGKQARVKSATDVREYYRSCGIDIGATS